MCAFVPAFQCLFQGDGTADFEIDLAKWPALKAFMERIAARPSAQAAAKVEDGFDKKEVRSLLDQLVATFVQAGTEAMQREAVADGEVSTPEQRRMLEQDFTSQQKRQRSLRVRA